VSGKAHGDRALTLTAAGLRLLDGLDPNPFGPPRRPKCSGTTGCGFDLAHCVCLAIALRRRTP
jgi:hypothetical protein